MSRLLFNNRLIIPRRNTWSNFVSVWTHQSVNDGSNCSVEHMQPGDLLSDIRKAPECEISHTDTPLGAAVPHAEKHE